MRYSNIDVLVEEPVDQDGCFAQYLPVAPFFITMVVVFSFHSVPIFFDSFITGSMSKSLGLRIDHCQTASLKCNITCSVAKLILMEIPMIFIGNIWYKHNREGQATFTTLPLQRLVETCSARYYKLCYDFLFHFPKIDGQFPNFS